jgi:dTDP-4-dehydrorhamnose reductase
MHPVHSELDALDALEACLRRSPAEAVLNLVACTDLDAAELERGNVEGVVYRTKNNADLVGHLARLCPAAGKRLVHVSTDYVFDGEQADRPYREADPLHPGLRHPRSDFAGFVVARLQLRAGQEVVAVDDQKITPIFLDDERSRCAHSSSATGSV